MITAIKARLETLSQLKTVELADAIESDLIEQLSLDPELAPSVLLYYGPTKYLNNETKMHVRQQTVKTVVALLFCQVADLEALEDAVVRRVLGYCHTPAYTGMTAVTAVTAVVAGPMCARRIEFSTEFLISQE